MWVDTYFLRSQWISLLDAKSHTKQVRDAEVVGHLQKIHLNDNSCLCAALSSGAPWLFFLIFCKHILVILRASSHLLNKKKTKKFQSKILNMKSNVHARLWVMSVNKFGTNEFC